MNVDFFTLYSLGRKLRSRTLKPLPKASIPVHSSEVADNNENIVEQQFTVDSQGNLIGNYIFMVILNISPEYYCGIFSMNISAEYFSSL